MLPNRATYHIFHDNIILNIIHDIIQWHYKFNSFNDILIIKRKMSLNGYKTPRDKLSNKYTTNFPWIENWRNQG